MKPSLLSKLDQLTQRLEEVSALMNQEGATADMEHYRKLTREHAELEPLVAVHAQWTQAQADLIAAQDMMSDPEMKSFAQEEMDAAQARAAALELDLQKMMLPKDPNDDRNKRPNMPNMIESRDDFSPNYSFIQGENGQQKLRSTVVINYHIN